MTATSTRTAARIAEHRRVNGEFGTQPHDEAGVVLVTEDFPTEFELDGPGAGPTVDAYEALTGARDLTTLRVRGEELLCTRLALVSWSGQQRLSDVRGSRLEMLLEGPDGERISVTSRSLITPSNDLPGFYVQRMTNAVRLDDVTKLPVSHPVSGSSMTAPDYESATRYALWANTKGLIEARPEEIA